MRRVKKRQLKKNHRGDRVWFFKNGAALRFAATRSGKTNDQLNDWLGCIGVQRERIDQILNGEIYND